MSRNRAHARSFGLVEPLEGRQLMSFDTYLQLGAAAASGSKAGQPIEVYSFNWVTPNPVTVGSGGKVSVSSFSVMIMSDEAGAAKLFTDAETGEHFATSEVIMKNAGTGSTYLTYDFTDVYVESIQWSGSSGGDDTPTESVTFGFDKVSIEYAPQGTTSGGPISLDTSVTDDVAKTKKS